MSDRPETAQARYYNRIIPVKDGDSGVLEIVLQVSNYLHSKGGLRAPSNWATPPDCGSIR